MKKAFIFFILFHLCLAISLSAQQKANRYAIKSGHIEYELSGNTTGTKSLWFDDYGAKTYTETKSVTTTKILGFTNTEEKHEISIVNGTDVYFIDKTDGSATKSSIAGFTEMADFTEDMSKEEQEEFEEEILASLGGQKIGTEKVLGYECEIIEIMGSKSWVYKGISLKNETNVMGIVMNSMAGSFEKNIKIPASRFEPPSDITFEDVSQYNNYNIYDESEEDDEYEYGSNVIPLSYPYEDFLEGIAGFDYDGHKRMMANAEGGEYMAAYMKGFGSMINISAMSMQNGDKADEDSNAGFENFTHDGKKMRYGTEINEEEGGSVSAMVIEYPKHDMYIYIMCIPEKSKAEMLKMYSMLNFK